MHDVDRTMLEYPSELYEYAGYPEIAQEQYGYSGEAGSVMSSVFGEAQAAGAFEVGGYQESQGLPLSELVEQELATEFLEVRSDQELDHFLGNLFNKVAGAVGRFAKTPVGQAIGGVLKQVAKQALTQAGQMAGSALGGPAGGMIGSQVGTMAGQAFGLEVEGLSPEDRDFEVAKQYVRFAADAAKKATFAPSDIDPVTAAKGAVVEAAKKYAPGLLAPLAGAGAAPPRPGAAPPYPPPPVPPSGARGAPRPGFPGAYPYAVDGFAPTRYRRQGKWIRRGRHIVVLGV